MSSSSLTDSTSMSSTSTSSPPPLTKHQLKQQHKAELKSLSSLPIYKGKGGNKKLKDDETKMMEKHKKELEEYDKKTQQEEAAAASESSSISPFPSSLPPSTTHFIPSYSQLRRQRRAEAEALRHSANLSSASSMSDLKSDENKQFDTKLTPLGMEITDIKADGSCLFRAIADQIVRKNVKINENIKGKWKEFIQSFITERNNKSIKNWNEETFDVKSTEFHWILREISAYHILNHPEQFSQHIMDDDNEDVNVPQYIDKLVSRDTVMWGSFAEIVAIGKEIQKDIVIHHARGEDIKIQWNEGEGEATMQDDPIRISFHQYYFGLGEHYNSVITKEKDNEKEK